MSGTIIIGAGQAGSAVAAKLRNIGYEGDITLIGAETAPPYQRPPLSKKYMLGEMELERLYLRPIDFYKTNSPSYLQNLMFIYSPLTIPTSSLTWR